MSPSRMAAVDVALWATRCARYLSRLGRVSQSETSTADSFSSVFGVGRSAFAEATADKSMFAVCENQLFDFHLLLRFGLAQLMFQRSHFTLHFAHADVSFLTARPIEEIDDSSGGTAE